MQNFSSKPQWQEASLIGLFVSVNVHQIVPISTFQKSLLNYVICFSL